MTIPSTSFGNSFFPYLPLSASVDPHSTDHIPRNVSLLQDFQIKLRDSSLCVLLGVKEFVIKEGSVVNEEGSGWGFLAYQIPGKIGPALYTGPIKNFEPHGYGSILFSDGLGQYDGPFTNGIPGGFGVHRTSTGVMRRIGEIRFKVSEGCMEFVLHGIGEYRGSDYLKAGFFEDDQIQGPGMILRDETLKVVNFRDDDIVSDFAYQLPSFFFVLEDQCKKKPLQPTAVISYLDDTPSEPPSGIRLNTPLIIKDQNTQAVVSVFPTHSILSGFDASGTTHSFGSCETPYFNLEAQRLFRRLLESRFSHFEPQGYGRKYYLNGAGLPERIVEGAFGPDPLGRANFPLHGFGRVLDREENLLKAGFFQIGTLHGPGIRGLTPAEEQQFPRATKLCTFFKKDLPRGGPAIYYDAAGNIVQRGFYVTTPSKTVFYPMT